MDIFSGLTDIVKEPLVEWQKRKTVRVTAEMEVEKILAEAEIEKARTKLELAKSGQIIEADWDARAQEAMKFSLKDEALLLIIYSPVVMLFISIFVSDEFQQRVIQSVQALNDFPNWYKITLMGIIASVFGLRWLIAPVVQRFKGKKDA